jgi:hypothetical protein
MIAFFPYVLACILVSKDSIGLLASVKSATLALNAPFC